MRNGFTLIEMVVVMALLSIAMLVATPAILRVLEPSPLEASAAELVRTIAAARQHALSAAGTVALIIDAGAQRSWELDPAPDGGLMPSAPQPIELKPGIELRADRGRARFTFARTGAGSGDPLVIVASDDSLRVRVDPVTGRVRVAR